MTAATAEQVGEVRKPSAALPTVEKVMAPMERPIWSEMGAEKAGNGRLRGLQCGTPPQTYRL